jgi:aminoglycoside phosphotransferase family enzyme/predicted kinase
MTDTPQDDVIAFLADPGTHGLAADAVTHIRTHISDVILAGDLVYKVKRAVRFSFVDLTALADRHAACEAEVRLNRRTAPDIYLGVVAVRRGTDGRFVLERLDRPGQGEVVEWAVVLRRFDEDQTFDRIARRGELKEERIVQLVDAIVALHEAAELRGPPFGGAEALRRIVAENAADMATQPGALDPAAVEALTGILTDALEDQGDYLDARRAAGCVRQCHGDLHLGNVVLWQGRPTLFDCIEFSETISVIDVFYDFAFLLMDLEFHGLTALANRALSRYIGRTGEAAALRVMPLMLAVRASVRAKVYALALGGEPDAAARADQETAARRYLTAAKDFIAPAPQAKLVAVGGLSGSGKTTLARVLAPGLGRAPGALHLRSDLIRKRLAHVLPEARLAPRSYTPEASAEVYAALMAEAEDALRAGQWVIADAVFARPEERAAIQAVASRAGVAFQGVWLEAPAEVMAGRVTARVGDASDATAEVVAQQLDIETGDITWSRFANTGGPEAVAQAIRALLEPAP